MRPGNPEFPSLLGTLSLAFLACWQEPAFASDEVTAQPADDSSSTGQSDASAYNGEDITRPERRVQLRVQTRSSDTNDKTLVRLEFQYTFQHDAGWDSAWLLRLPVGSRRDIASGDMTSSVEDGLGDVELQGALLHQINTLWGYGFGARLTAPSGDGIGSGKWQIKPIIGFRYSLIEGDSDTYFVPKLRYAFGFGGDSSRRDISEAQFAPTLNIGLPDRWFMILFPSFDIRMNFGAPVSGQTGKLFLPFDAALGRKIGENTSITLEIGVPVINNYPVYKFKGELRTAVKF